MTPTLEIAHDAPLQRAREFFDIRVLERQRLLASLSMALAIGQGRAAPGHGAGFEPRYVSLAALWWCSVVAMCLIHTPVLGRIATAGVCALLLIWLPAHLRFLLGEGRKNRDVTDSFALDVAQGLGTLELASRYPNCFLNGPSVFAAKLDAMREFGLWPPLERYAQERARHIGTEKVSPRRIESAQPVAYRWVNGHFVLVGALDHELEFTCPQSASKLSGSFEISAAPFDGLGAEGVHITIELAGANPAVLYERTLFPGTTLADRGFQTFAVDLPPRRDADGLALRAVRTGPASEQPALVMWAQLRLD